MAFGVTDTGFNVKTLPDIMTSLQSKQSQTVAPTLDFQPTGLIGQLNGIFAAELAEGWLAALADYNGMDPDQAAGDQLTNIALITGTERQDAAATLVLATLDVDPSFNANPGDLLASIAGNPSAVFRNRDTVSSTPGGTLTGIFFECLTTGPVQCLAGTLTVIASPFGGWNSITNPLDGTPGHDVQGDISLRQTRNQELAAAGTSTADAIRADVLEKMQPPTTTTATINCRVNHNEGDVTDVNGLPPHTIEVIAFQPGATTADNDALASLIFTSKTGATGTYGLTSRIVTDEQGNAEAVFFTRPSPITLYIAITVVVDPKTFPLDGPTQVINALLNYAAFEYGPGDTVYLRALSSSVFPSPIDPNVGVVGVKNITSFTCDTNPTPVGTADIVVGVRQVAAFDSARIFVTVA